MIPIIPIIVFLSVLLVGGVAIIIAVRRSAP
jgi:hypothetical protein